MVSTFWAKIVAFTPTPIPPWSESWSLSWAGRGGPISSYQILTCLDVNLDYRVDRGKILCCQNFFPINTIASTIGTIASDRMTSSKRNKTHLIMFPNRAGRGRCWTRKNSMICWYVLRSTTICDSRAFTSWYDKMRVDTCLCALSRMQPSGCEFLRSHIYWTRFMYDFEINFSICTHRFPIFTQKCIFSNMLEVQR